jgi:hypothetical protein
MILVETAEFELVQAEDDHQENGDDADREHERGSGLRMDVQRL